MSDHELSEQARGLRGDIAGLAEGVANLANRTSQSERTVARIRRITLALVAVIALGTVSTVYLVVLGYQMAVFSHCQADYNAANNARTRALTEVSAAERAAERRAMDALFGAFADPVASKPTSQRTDADRRRIAELGAEIIAAGRALQTERADADAARAANPVPPPPDEVC